MFSPRIEDVLWSDAFRVPSIFDSRIEFYKEWHDFALYDPRTQLFALLNFGVHGNLYDSSRGFGAALAFIVEPTGKVHSAMKMMPIGEVTVSPFSPDFVGGGVNLSYVRRRKTFSIVGEIGDISLNLSLPVTSPPVTINQMGYSILSRNKLSPGMQAAGREMSRLWDSWVELPRLSARGSIRSGSTSYAVNTTRGYQDHEGGRFDWGTIKGWDIGVLLSDPNTGKEPARASFLFYRYGGSGESSYGGIVLRTKGGRETSFNSENTRVKMSGQFSKERTYLPGVTRLLYPDYRPHVPETIQFSAREASDRLKITFTPKAVCTIVTAGFSGVGETTFNEMFCNAKLLAIVQGERFDTTIPCWFESVRPRGRLKNDAPEA